MHLVDAYVDLAVVNVATHMSKCTLHMCVCTRALKHNTTRASKLPCWYTLQHCNSTALQHCNILLRHMRKRTNRSWRLRFLLVVSLAFHYIYARHVCVTVCCSVLQFVAVCSNWAVCDFVGIHCNTAATLQHTDATHAPRYNRKNHKCNSSFLFVVSLVFHISMFDMCALQCVAVCGSVLHCVRVNRVIHLPFSTTAHDLLWPLLHAHKIVLLQSIHTEICVHKPSVMFTRLYVNSPQCTWHNMLENTVFL